MEEEACRQAAHWLAEAIETGNPLAPLPPELAPRSAEEGDGIAALAGEALGLVACGLRLVTGPGGTRLAGPMFEGRLLPDGTGLPRAVLRHARATAALVAVLAEDLSPEGSGPPAIAAVHPAIDVTSSRFRDPPESDALLAADLCGLGHVVTGRRTPLRVGEVAVSLAPSPRRPRGLPVDLPAALAEAAAVARRMGGLPAGALLVLPGLSAPVTPEAGLTLVARFAGMGRVSLRIA